MQTWVIKDNPRFWLRQATWIACLAAIVIMSRKLFAGSELFESLLQHITADHDLSYLVVLASIYMLLLSIPFLPGVELGLLLMYVAGSKMVLIIYLFTVLGLSLSFAMGRWLPTQGLQVFLRKLGLSSAEDQELLINNLINRQAKKILGLKLMRYVEKNPYLVTAILLNIPGNFILGGGGGIAMLSGLNRRISWQYFVITVALAALPLPLLIFFGYVHLERFL